jgi:hypothetical protein
MSKLQLAYGMVGVTLMAFFGTRIGNVTTIGSLAVAAFALGIVLLSQMPAIGLLARMKRLEAELAAARDAAARSGARAG